MLTKFDASIFVETTRPFEQWCVYEHQVVMKEGEPPQTIMIGATKITDVYRLIDGKKNSEWCRIFRGGGSVLVRILAVTIDKAEAFRYAQELIRDSSPRPICNLKGYDMRSVGRRIECINTNQMYNSQAEAAQDLGISQSSISRHMRGDLEHAGGFRFVYVNVEEQ